jgi:hypothetical protein
MSDALAATWLLLRPYPIGALCRYEFCSFVPWRSVFGSRFIP